MADHGCHRYEKRSPPIAPLRPRPRVLVIDDDPLFRRLIVSALEAECDVLTANNGQAGFHSALEHLPDVVFTDIRMPEWDGPKTIRAMRGMHLLDDTKIVVLSGGTSEAVVLQAIRCGADDYIRKAQFSADELNRKLDKLLCRNNTKINRARLVDREQRASLSHVALIASRSTKNDAFVPDRLYAWD